MFIDNVISFIHRAGLVENWFSMPNMGLLQQLDRAVGAGPAGPAAVGPIFGQLTRAKMPYELWWVVQLLL